eukprot:tig00000123_g6901.t1
MPAALSERDLERAPLLDAIGLTSAIAGAISMGFGEYLATRSQNQRVRETLRAFNFDGEFLEEATRRIGADDEALLNFMMVTEFGQSADDLRRPWMVGGGGAGRGGARAGAGRGRGRGGARTRAGARAGRGEDEGEGGGGS